MLNAQIPPLWNGFSLTRSHSQSRQEQVTSFLRDAIIQGRLRKGARLPATRVLADELGLSRQTIVLAYERLTSEGLLQGRKGSGTFVATTVPIACDTCEKQSVRSSSDHVPSPMSRRGRRLLDLPVTPIPNGIRGVLSPGIPALDLFPWTTWNGVAKSMSRSSSLDRMSPGGLSVLRKAIADYVLLTRCINCDPDQIIITSGSHNALDLISKVTFDQDDIVWIESPGYVAGRGTLLANGAKIQPVPVDCDGLNVEFGKKTAATARAAFVTPAHQYPLGVRMSVARRIELLDWADEQNAWVVENDFDADFRYAGEPLHTLYTLSQSRGKNVIHVGTMSNVLAPGLRLGYLISPFSLLQAFRQVRVFADRQPPIPMQAQAAIFMKAGHLSVHMRRMRGIYRDRRDAMFEELSKKENFALDPGDAPPECGLHLTVRLASGDDTAISNAAISEGVRVPALSSYCFDADNLQTGLVLGFAGTPIDRARQAIASLKRIANQHA